jgi:hypothetical protein
MTRSTTSRLLCLLCLACGFAQAAPVQWTLTDVFFSDGGAATGSFVYDADTGIFTTIDIVTTAGSDFAGASYGQVLDSDPSVLVLVQSPGPDLTSSPILQLGFQLPLTNAGGPVALASFAFPPGPSIEGTCADAACDRATMARLTTEGGVVGVVVPVPPALFLAVSAFAALWPAHRLGGRTRAGAPLN